MRRATAIRRDTGTAPRRGFGLLVVLWLNLALMPCAMAFGTDQSHSHMPATAAEEMSGHHGHATADPAPCCGGLQVECCEAVNASVTTRSDDIQFDNKDGAELQAMPGYEVLQDLRPVVFSVVPPPPDPGGSVRPRHKVFCVYLD